MGNEAEVLADLLRSTVKRSVGSIDHIDLMFSGGLDSAILAVIARKYCDITLYTAGMEGSHDLDWGRECISLIDLPHVEIILQEEDIIQSMQNVVKLHGITNPKWMSTFAAFDLVFQKVRESHIMCGQGADELFGGYQKYGRMTEPEIVMAEGVKELVELEMPAYCKMAKHYDKILLAPYLDKELITYANTIPLSGKLNEFDNKIILRKAAEVTCVPGMMAHKQKKAMQYGAGISKIIKKYLKNEGINLETFINNNEI